MKRVALISALLESTWILDKNLLLVDGSPMAFYVARVIAFLVSAASSYVNGAVIDVNGELL